jgi:hypothetical protein
VDDPVSNSVHCGPIFGECVRQLQTRPVPDRFNRQGVGPGVDDQEAHPNTARSARRAPSPSSLAAVSWRGQGPVRNRASCWSSSAVHRSASPSGGSDAASGRAVSALHRAATATYATGTVTAARQANTSNSTTTMITQEMCQRSSTLRQGRTSQLHFSG